MSRGRAGIYKPIAFNPSNVSGCAELHAPGHTLAHVSGRASGRSISEVFVCQSITGDTANWLTLQDIPSFTA